jgi:hypothetical protein
MAAVAIPKFGIVLRGCADRHPKRRHHAHSRRHPRRHRHDDLGSDRRRRRIAAGACRKGSAAGAVSRGISGKSFVSHRGLSDRAVPAFAGDLAEPAHDPRNTMVHSVQCDCGRQRLSDRFQGSRGDIPHPRLALVARCHAAWDISILRHRRHHRLRRRMERQHRFRGRQLGADQAQWIGARCLHRADDGRRRLPENRTRRCIHVGAGGRHESPALASALRLRRTQNRLD